MRYIGFSLTVLLIVMTVSNPAQAQAQIEWRVQNPFKFFKNSKSIELHRAAFEAWKTAKAVGETREGPILFAEHYFAKAHQLTGSQGPYRGWAEAMVKQTCFNSWDARSNYSGWRAHIFHHSKCGKEYLNPKHHAVDIWLNGSVEGQNCTWTIKNRKTGNTTTKNGACSMHFPIAAPYPQGLSVAVSSEGSQASPVDIKVQDLLVVGVGDSFASGEGNPDVPMAFHASKARSYGTCYADGSDHPTVTTHELLGYPTRTDGFQYDFTSTGYRQRRSFWLDTACHRSLYSHQVRAAIQLALSKNHRAITFISYACTGAEIWDGILKPQNRREPERDANLANSQVQAIFHDICLSGLTRNSRLSNILRNGDAGYLIPEVRAIAGTAKEILRRCHRTKQRQIDLMLVSVGGNDIGFSSLIGNAILGHDQLWGNLGRTFNAIRTTTEAQNLLERLPGRYAGLQKIFRLMGLSNDRAKRVILTSYPEMNNNEMGQPCQGGRSGKARRSMDLYPAFQFSAQRALKAQKFANNNLYKVMKSAAQQFGWSFVTAYPDHENPAVSAFKKRGTCAQDSSRANEISELFSLPIQKTNGNWRPYNPANFSPYAPRQRWYRTPNDAFMTTHYQSHLELKTSHRLPMAGLYSGAFHPTAEGQAAIADAVVKTANELLD